MTPALDYSLTALSYDPDTQVAQTIAVMCRYAIEDSLAPEIRQAALTAVVEADASSAVEAVWNYVRSRMSFVEDEVSAAPVQALHPHDPVVEVLNRPRDTVRWLIGDCDDFSVLGASLLTALSVPVSFATVAADAQEPGVYSHVYLVAYPAGVRTPMDLSHGKSVGWETPNRFGKLREWPVGGLDAEGLG